MIEEIINLIENNYRIFPLRGNHEDMMWKAHLKDYDEETLKLPVYKWDKNIVDKQRNIPEKYVKFISKLPYYYILDKFYLVHAGFDFSQANPFENLKYMLWNVNLDVNTKKIHGKTIIHGHTHRSINEVNNRIKNKELIIGLDNSINTKYNPNYGNLLCLNLDPYELIIQQNID